MGRKPIILSNIYAIGGKLKGEVVEPDDEVEAVEPAENLVELLMPSFGEFLKIDAENMRRLWVEIAGVVNQTGYLNEINALAIRDIIPVYNFYRAANVEILEQGKTYMVEGRNGDQMKSHALIGAVTAWKKEINSFIGDFGLTPVSKKRLEQVAEQGNLFGAEFANNGKARS